MENRNISVEYALTAPMGENNEVTTIEVTKPGRPFQFITGMGMVLDSLEQKLSLLNEGEEFDITLSPEEAYGPYIPEGVHDVPLEAFFVEGKFDKQHIYEGAIVPMQDGEGQQFTGIVQKVTDKHVTVDLNHPLAGKALTFKGKMLQNHVASNQEIQEYMNQFQSGCGGCHGGCGGGGCHSGGCEGSCEGGCEGSCKK